MRNHKAPDYYTSSVLQRRCLGNTDLSSGKTPCTHHLGGERRIARLCLSKLLLHQHNSLAVITRLHKNAAKHVLAEIDVRQHSYEDYITFSVIACASPAFITRRDSRVASVISLLCNTLDSMGRCTAYKITGFE